MEHPGVGDPLERGLLRRPFRRSSRMGEMHDDDEIDTGFPEVRAKGRGIDGEVPGLHRIADRCRGHSAVAVEPHGPGDARGVEERRAVTAVAAGRAFGRPVEVRYRPDGRPEVDGEHCVSASHGAGLTLCVVSTGTVGCDVEAVTVRSQQDWDGLLGANAPLAELVAQETGDGRDAAGTRVWAAVECLQKVGVAPGAPLTLTPTTKDAWTVFASGTFRIATLVTTLRGAQEPVVFAVLTEGRS